MTTRTVRFLSGNDFKIREVARILAPIQVIPARRKIDEIQTDDVTALVRDKTLKAFAAVGRPLFVEHTGLELEGLNGLPGGLTQVFWDSLGAERFVNLANGLATRHLTARTTIGYCDGYRLQLFEGAVRGKVSEAPRGPRDFQWDCVFIPDGYEQTFAELSHEKDGISMRRIALDRLRTHLGG